MLESIAADFVLLTQRLSALEKVGGKLKPPISDDERDDLFSRSIDRLGEVESACEVAGLAVSAGTCAKLNAWILENWGNANVHDTVTDAMTRIAMLQDVVQTDISSVLVYRVPAHLVTCYNELQFDEDVLFYMHDSIYDMDEAGKCFALGRHTACAFHLMRVAEAGFGIIREQYGLAERPTWQAFLNQIKGVDNGLDWIANHIDLLPKREIATEEAESAPLDPVADIKLQRKAFSEISERVLSLKNVWRNPTMHVVRQYAPEEAREVFDATKRFMSILVTECVPVFSFQNGSSP